MTGRDDLLKWLEQVNPVPDPSQLRADLKTPHDFGLADKQRGGKPLTVAGVKRLTPGPRDRRLRRGLLVATATATLVVILGAVIAFVAADRTEVAGNGPRVLQLRFDGQQCSFQGPSVLSAGEVEITWHNESTQRVWASFLRLDDDKTTQDFLDYVADVSNRDKPSWTQYVSAFWSSVPIGSSTEPRLATVRPGLHVLVCGTWTPYVGYLGSDLIVVP